MKEQHYSKSEISDAKKKLLELSGNGNIPEEYSVQMFRAFEIITQMQEETEVCGETGQDSTDDGWVTDGTLPTLEDSITRDENRPEYMQFLCTIQIGDKPRQVRRLYFDTEKGWLQCGSDYNKYVVGWKSLPKPFMGDIAKELCRETKKALLERGKDIFVKSISAQKELVAEVLSDTDGNELSVVVTVRDEDTKEEIFSSGIPYSEAEIKLYGLLKTALGSEMIRKNGSIFPDGKTVEQIRKDFPAGTRIVLAEMNDAQAPPPGTKGTVRHVDDTGTIFAEWDNGSGIGVVYGIDRCEKAEEEQK